MSRNNVNPSFYTQLHIQTRTVNKSVQEKVPKGHNLNKCSNVNSSLQAKQQLSQICEFDEFLTRPKQVTKGNNLEQEYTNATFSIYTQLHSQANSAKYSGLCDNLSSGTEKVALRHILREQTEGKGRRNTVMFFALTNGSGTKNVTD